MLLSVMILLILPISSIAVSNQDESEKTEKQKLDEFTKCVKQYPCKNDDIHRDDLTEQQKQELYLCRLTRLLKCSVPEKNE